jgi:hypothetical protein
MQEVHAFFEAKDLVHQVIRGKVQLVSTKLIAAVWRPVRPAGFESERFYARPGRSFSSHLNICNFGCEFRFKR